MKLSLFHSYSPHPLDASFVLSSALIGFSALRHSKLSNVQVAGALITALACAALGALRFVAGSELQDLKDRILSALSMRDWDVVADPKEEVMQYERAIKRLTQKRQKALEHAFNTEKALGSDQFHQALWRASKNHPGASHFYHHLKVSIYRNLSGILPLASGSVARTLTTAADYSGALLKAGGSVPVIGPLLSAAGNGCSYASNASEVSYCQKVAKLFSEPINVTFFVRWVALHYTLVCAKSLPYLDKKGAQELAEKIATCALNHLVYNFPQDSADEEAPFDLLKVAKATVKSVDWSAHHATTFDIKKALSGVQKAIKFAEILGLAHKA